MDKFSNAHIYAPNMDVSKIEQMIQDYSEIIKEAKKVLKQHSHNENKKLLLAMVADERAAFEKRKHERGVEYKSGNAKNRDTYWIKKAQAKLNQQKIDELEKKVAELSNNASISV